MLQSIFLWFYCLSISDAILLVLVFAITYLFFRQWLEAKRFWRPVISLLFLAWIAVLAIATLTDRTPGSVPSVPELIPFHSYRAVLSGGNIEILRSNFMNVILFFPAGLLLCELLPEQWSRTKRISLAVVLFMLASVGIEFCQYRFSLGQAEADDVLHNALGALLGAIVNFLPLKQQ